MTVGYALGISLRILSPVTRPVTFVVVMQYFPPLTGSGVVVPLTRVTLPAISASALAPPAPAPADLVGLRSYLAVDTLCPLPHHVVPPRTKTLAESVYLPLMSLHSLGSVSGGSKLRIVFPLIGNQEPQAAAGLSSFPLHIGELSRAIKNHPSLPQQLYQPDIAPAFTEYVGAGEDLSNFEALSGDPPALTPAKTWSWSGVSDITLLAQDLVAADAEQKRLFWSGILIGVAGGGVIALALELIGVRENLSQRRKATQKASQQ